MASRNTAFPWKVFLPVVAVLVIVNVVILRLTGVWKSEPLPEKTSEPPALAEEFSASPSPDAPAGEPSQSQPAAALAVRRDNPPPPPWNFAAARPLPGSFCKALKMVRSGILVDQSRHRVLWAKNPDLPVPVASLTKLMTALLVMEELDAGRNDPEPLTWQTLIPVTAAATGVERSSVLGMCAGEKYAVGEMMAAVLICSRNDAAAQLAECTAGSVPEFVARMNRRAKELRLKSARFNSPNGLPQGKQRLNSYCSAADIARVCEVLLRYPQILELCVCKQKKLHTGKILYSTNKLLRRNLVPGYEGYKTGYTSKAGFCLAFGAVRNGRRIIGCVTGFPSSADRDNFCRKLIEWGFAQR